MARIRHRDLIHQDPLARELRELARPTFTDLPTRYLERDAPSITRSIYPDLSPEPRVSALTPTDSSSLLRDSPQALVPVPRLRAPAGPDRRAFHPLAANAPASQLNGAPADLTTNPVERSSAVQVFKNAHHVVPCIQRTVRREVMFAVKKAGKGHKKKKRRNWMSNIGC